MTVLSPRSSSRPLAFLALALLAPLAACTPDDDASDGTTGCAERVRVASLAAEPDEQVRLLDEALLACNSYDGFRTQVGRYPGIIGYDVNTFLELRCERADDDRITNTAACRAVVAPPTTPPPDTEVELVFVGDTVDGRRVEIRPSADVPFEGDIPAVVQQTVDIAVESGCPGVLDQRDLWLAQIDDSPTGDVASVFAQHAQNVAVYIGCEPTPIDGSTAG
ncbi:MAG: hypothetical protein CL424_11140 [Acidimicrobiaceae bacterium]|nr:hypothetical protein [Acidimicrobiaceae bacterium]